MHSPDGIPLMTMKSPTAALLLAAFVLTVSACASLQDASTNPAYAKTRTGTGIGAAAGAVIGLLTHGDKFDNALIGAALGGIAGGAIGNYQDRQEQKLRQQMAGTGVQVVRKDDNITLNMPGGITFLSNAADVRAESYPILDKVASTLNEYHETMVEVAGHTDSTGSSQYNQRLSERRANSVAAYLESRGVDAKRLIVVGDGEKDPIASNDSPAGRQQNRRVELTIVPVATKT